MKQKDTFIKCLIVFALLYLALHVGLALSAQSIVINTPTGGQTVCIVDGQYVTCY